MQFGKTTNELGNKIIGFSSQFCQCLPFQSWVLWEPQFPQQLGGWVGLIVSECCAANGFSAQVPQPNYPASNPAVPLLALCLWKNCLPQFAHLQNGEICLRGCYKD